MNELSGKQKSCDHCGRWYPTLVHWGYMRLCRACARKKREQLEDKRRSPDGRQDVD